MGIRPAEWLLLESEALDVTPAAHRLAATVFNRAVDMQLVARIKQRIREIKGDFQFPAGPDAGARNSAHLPQIAAGVTGLAATAAGAAIAVVRARAGIIIIFFFISRTPCFASLPSPDASA